MKNFKEIAEKCLAGELSGTFVLRNKLKLSSKHLTQPRISGRFLCPYDILEHSYSEKGSCHHESLHLVDYDIIDFIPNNMKEQMKIDIPEGKVPVMEQTESGVVITWKEKELTYKDIESKIILRNTRDCIIAYTPVIEHIKTFDCPNSDFYKKVEVLRKLTNIRNYFGGDKPTNSWLITIDSAHRPYVIKNPRPYRESCYIYFDTQEHAEQAIKMLGDELKYLFEPW